MHILLLPQVSVDSPQNGFWDYRRMSASVFGHFETPASVEDSLVKTQQLCLLLHSQCFLLGTGQPLSGIWPHPETGVRLSWDSRCWWEVFFCFRIWWRPRMCLLPGGSGSKLTQFRGTSTGRTCWRIMGTLSYQVSAVTLLVSGCVSFVKGLLQSDP